MGVSKKSVQRIWNAQGVKPPLVQRFKLSPDPQLVEKRQDGGGLYLNPPAQALVLSRDEKSPMQALERTHPGRPLKKGRLGTMTHDDKRNGTTTLFAALDVRKGEGIGRCMPRPRPQEFLKFLKILARTTPPSLALVATFAAPANADYWTRLRDKIRDEAAKVDPTNQNGKFYAKFKICNETKHTMPYRVNTKSDSLQPRTRRFTDCTNWTTTGKAILKFDSLYKSGYQGHTYSLNDGKYEFIGPVDWTEWTDVGGLALGEGVDLRRSK